MTPALIENSRALLTALHEAAVQGANPYVRTHEAVREWLHASAFPASTRLHIFAMGKAAATMSAGAWQALKEHGITLVGGACVPAAAPSAYAQFAPAGEFPVALEVRVGDHPVPNIGSLAAADLIARRVKEVQKYDIALVLISGGATSLCASPCDELRDTFGHVVPAHELLTQLIGMLHRRGLAIHEMNAIRRRLLRWGGGRLAVALANQGASHIRVFSVSDVIGDDPAVIGSGPCSPDPMSETEFLAMLDAYSLRDDIPRELAVAFGLQGSPQDAILPPHPGDHAFSLVDYTVVARNQDSCRAMAVRAEAEGLRNVTVVEAPLTGEAETLGHTMASVAIRAANASNEAQVIIWGGEPTVRMDDVHMQHRVRGNEDSDGPLPDTLNIAGPNAKPRTYMSPLDDHHEEGPEGGRMQALALAAALRLEQAAFNGRTSQVGRISLLAAGTDGRDGPTDACGAIVTMSTPGKSRLHGRDPIRDLHRLRSYPALNAANALLRTGPTGTNVMDVVAVYVAAATTTE
ncbi:MAG: DUF4147 domain-containing protein [Gemmatimonas sp.]